jgi:hypothetical protein
LAEHSIGSDKRNEFDAGQTSLTFETAMPFSMASWKRWSLASASMARLADARGYFGRAARSLVIQKR